MSEDRSMVVDVRQVSTDHTCHFNAECDRKFEFQPWENGAGANPLKAERTGLFGQFIQRLAWITHQNARLSNEVREILSEVELKSIGTDRLLDWLRNLSGKRALTKAYTEDVGDAESDDDRLGLDILLQRPHRFVDLDNQELVLKSLVLDDHKRALAIFPHHPLDYIDVLYERIERFDAQAIWKRTIHIQVCDPNNGGTRWKSSESEGFFKHIEAETRRFGDMACCVIFKIVHQADPTIDAKHRMEFCDFLSKAVRVLENIECEAQVVIIVEVEYKVRSGATADQIEERSKFAKRKLEEILGSDQVSSCGVEKCVLNAPDLISAQHLSDWPNKIGYRLGWLNASDPKRCRDIEMKLAGLAQFKIGENPRRFHDIAEDLERHATTVLGTIDNIKQ